jgi:5-methylcytosine-specific restriction endonuclease McrA
MTPKRRTRLLKRAGWTCAVPDCQRGPLELDHRVPLELGGSEDDENIVALCRAHHLAKSLNDLKRIAKARRIRKKKDGSAPAKRPLPSRGFDKRMVVRV